MHVGEGGGEFGGGLGGSGVGDGGGLGGSGGGRGCGGASTLMGMPACEAAFIVLSWLLAAATLTARRRVALWTAV